MRKRNVEEKILDVDASMQGSLVFKDPVNLRINGTFEGSLDIKGNLTIGENAQVKADIKGENIVVAGEVRGDIFASSSLKLVPPARIFGDIKSPTLQVAEGALLQGNCQMVSGGKTSGRFTDYLTTDEVARYLEIDPSMVIKWVNAGKLPGVKEKEDWRFERTKIDEWIANEKIR